jgi:hypothetical protein
VLRGLILVSVKNEGTEDGTITARLINGTHRVDGMLDRLHQATVKAHEKHMAAEKDVALRSAMEAIHAKRTQTQMAHGLHHMHKAEVQIFNGNNDDVGLKSLAPGEDLDIQIGGFEYVSKQPSYDRYMPKLGEIAGLAKLDYSSPDRAFVSHTVSVNRGSIRVRDVGDWDAGSPDIPDRYRDPEEVYQPAKVRFLGAPVYGYVATECVIDVDNSDSLTIAGSGEFAGRHTGSANASLRVPENTVEILITNYASQQSVPLPWTLHYGWMFQAAGYVPKSLSGDELTQLITFAEMYDKEAWDDEAAMFLGEGNSWYPFPYRDPSLFRVKLGGLDYNSEFEPSKTANLVGADPWDPVRCPMGDCSTGGC